MTVADLISILHTMPPEAVVVMGEHNRETYETVAQDDAHDTQGVPLG